MSGATGLTRRGWALVAVAASLAIVGFLFGVVELFPVAAAAAVLLLSARVWVERRGWDVRVVRHVRPARVPAGVAARVELAVVNHGDRRSPVLAARDPFLGGKRWARFLVAPLEPGETRLAAYSLPTSERGVFPLGPLELELSDPFGLARVVTVGCPASSLTVHPRVERIRSRHVPAEPDPDTRVPLPVVGRVGDEFYGLREYRVGDDLRRVHWAATARVDELMIRQPENLLQGRLTVAVDLRAEVHDHPSLEACLSAAASIVMAALRGRVHARLVTTAGADSGFGTTAAHGAAILDILAAAVTHQGSTLSEQLKVGTGPVSVITTRATSDSDIAAVIRTGRGAGSTVVIFERAGRGPLLSPSGQRAPQCRVVSVGVGNSFRAAWEGASC